MEISIRKINLKNVLRALKIKLLNQLKNLASSSEPGVQNDTKYFVIFYSAIVIIISFFTYFYNYDYPSALFWDENYHIASSQKYIEGAMFMEPHPPLGKMFIAAGEVLFNENQDLDTGSFAKTDYITEVPDGYSFKGVRFFPSLFAWFSALLFFLTLLTLIKNPHIAFLFSSFYMFDNAIIVHSRGAMLEGIQIFFILLTVLLSAIILNKKDRVSSWLFVPIGLAAGLALSVKVTSAILLLLLPFLIFREIVKYKKQQQVSSFLSLINRDYRAISKMVLTNSLAFIIPMFLVFFAVFTIHFCIGTKVINNNYYGASEQYKNALNDNDARNPINFPKMFYDNVKFVSSYNKGVPKLDVKKTDENGSHPITWPIGNKTINFRWSKDGDYVSYLYLQGNPTVWFVSLGGLILATVLVIGHFIFGIKIKDKRLFYSIMMFTALYYSYMAAILQIDRVLYLYHYFIPLIFSMILTALIFAYLSKTELIRDRWLIYFNGGFIFFIVILSFIFYSPLTYYQPLNKKEFESRVLFDVWQLKPVE